MTMTSNDLGSEIIARFYTSAIRVESDKAEAALFHVKRFHKK
jgi:hypothetical protein